MNTEVVFRPILRPLTFKVGGGRGEQGIPADTDVGICFSGLLKSNERVGFVVTGNAQYVDSYCRAKITPGSGPSVAEVLGVYHNDVQVGTLTVNPDESCVWAFGTINAVDNDDIELRVGATPSADIQNLKTAFSGPFV